MRPSVSLMPLTLIDGCGVVAARRCVGRLRRRGADRFGDSGRHRLLLARRRHHVLQVQASVRVDDDPRVEVVERDGAERDRHRRGPAGHLQIDLRDVEALPAHELVGRQPIERAHTRKAERAAIATGRAVRRRAGPQAAAGGTHRVQSGRRCRRRCSGARPRRPRASRPPRCSRRSTHRPTAAPPSTLPLTASLPRWSMPRRARTGRRRPPPCRRSRALRLNGCARTRTGVPIARSSNATSPRSITNA